MPLTYGAVTSGSSPQDPDVRPPVGDAKPKLRGWLHALMTPAFFGATLWLLLVVPGVVERVGIGIYLLSGLLLFGNSACYHLGQWSPKTQIMLRRLDHANIFVFIAGSYTPLALTMLDARRATILLAIIWPTALAGVIFNLIWLHAPRWLYTLLYVALGWAALGWLPEFWATGGPAIVWWIIAGGVIYSAGALIYARKRPNPAPRWFGFHEIFHLCTIAAAVCHFVAIALAVS